MKHLKHLRAAQWGGTGRGSPLQPGQASRGEATEKEGKMKQNKTPTQKALSFPLK